MKIGFLKSLTVAAVAASCTCAARLSTGDLVFVEGDASDEADAAIVGATGEMSHVGIVEVADDGVYVIDATSKGVRRQTIAEFMELHMRADGTGLHFARIRPEVGVSAEEMDSFVENAKMLTGCGYDYAFLPDNDKYYCSELVYVSYVRDGEHLFRARPMNFRNREGGFDRFWVELFAEQGMEVPQDIEGTNPSDMLRSDILEEIQIEY